jgi:uncharacterized membrane protein YoaK (UPF0700 family)
MTSEPIPTGETLPLLLSLNAGYVDTAGFIALHGLFTAHVTGNFVTLGYALAHGAGGIWAKLAALPVFCLGVLLARLYGQRRSAAGLPAFRPLMATKVLLLLAAAVMAVTLGPFEAPDGWNVFAVGMTLVLAMAVQNAAHRLYLGSAPPSTLMTGTTTQIMLDAADVTLGVADPARGPRMARMIRTVAAFALGCAAAALLYLAIGLYSFAVPPVVALAAWAAAVRPA